MTITEKSHTNNNYYISIGIEEKYNKINYLVQVCPIISENICGYPIRKTTYSINEKTKAYNTFNRYIKKYI